LILKLWYNDNCDELICVSRNDNAIHVDVNTWSFATNFMKTSVFYAGVFFVCEKTESPISHCGNVLWMFYHEEGMNTVVEIILKRTMIYDYILLLIGFGLLMKGADLFVDGESNIARLLLVPAILVGLTIVALGTSAPEATVSITAALKGSADVSLGNVIGSNIFNITLVVGIAAFLDPLKVENETIKKEIPFTILA